LASQAYTRRSSCVCSRAKARDCQVIKDPTLRRARLEYPETSGTKMKYAVVIEKTETGYSAYVPDLPGCVSAGNSRPEMDRNIREAIELYLDELREQGLPIPLPTTDTEYVAV